MLSAIGRVGSLTPTGRKKLQQVGIQIFEDTRILEALEVGSPQVQAAAR